MSTLTVTKTRLLDGVWEGFVTGSGDTRPAIEVTHLERAVEGASLTEDAGNGRWVLRIPVPAEAIADGVQTFLIRDAETGDMLDSFTLISGEALAEDIRAEVDLLRAELDMLKRAFRRHCVDTM